tara:strand:- start:15888 stop:17108 length:1221 start_codon:yes stop_codon:yes gene_type:complete
MSIIKFEVISLFPKAFDSLKNMGIISRAINNNLIKVNLYNLRDFGEGSYKQVDDLSYGGGPGMVLKPGPIYKTYDSIEKTNNSLTLLMTPQGKVLKQRDFKRWASFDQLVIICGQYEGFDERIRYLAHEEISIGDFILTGGEIPAIAIINGLTRVLPGALGDQDSLVDESHNSNLLEYPQYTRPKSFRGMEVPKILLSGNHEEIKSWRYDQMLKRTFERREDLISYKDFKNLSLSKRINKEQKNFMRFRIGNGYDIHRLKEGRDLIIGGVKLEHPNNLGLDGHSDADVLSHAIMDGLLGALSLGDIGKYFPPSEAEWKNADSLVLLANVVKLIKSKGWSINNIDSVIVAERPKFQPHISSMKENLSNVIEIDKDLIGIKATTNETLGPEGREEGICCHAVVLLEKE